MSLESNKDDFEAALNNMELFVGDLEQIVNEDIAKALNEVISEYQCHLQGDIEKAMDKIDLLLDRIEELESDLADAREQAE